MALALKDRVKETTIVVGTGTATLLGSSIGFQPFSVVGNGNTTYYCISDQFGSNWEVGIGTYSSSGNTLARTTVLASSNGGALVVFTAGVKDVFVTYPAEKGVWLDDSNNAIGLGTPAAFVGTNITGTASGLTAGNVTTNANLTGAVTSTGNATSLGSFTSANLATALTDETGTGSAVFATSPTLVTPALGIPASGVVTNLTGTASININGTVGATTATTGAFTTLAYTGTLTGSTGILNIGSGQVYKDASGNVGIGTSSPTQKLTVAGGLLVTDEIKSDNNLNLQKATLNNIYFTDAIAFAKSGTGERMRIDSSGNVGIGTSSPILGLTIKNDTGSTTYGQRGGSLVLESYNFTAGGGTDVVWSSGTQTNQRYASIGSGIVGNDGASGSRGDLIFATKATSAATTLAERMRIASSGIVTMNAYGAGAATFSASGVISSVSDETWKIKDGVPNNPDEMIQKLKPGYWFYNAEKAPIFGTDRQLGFYAQNVNEAIGIEAAPVPEEGKPWGYYDRSVLAVAVMSLQKALTTIESLTERLTALENK